MNPLSETRFRPEEGLTGYARSGWATVKEIPSDCEFGTWLSTSFVR